MSDDELRTALARLAAPAEPRPGAVVSLTERVRRRRGRKRGTAALAAAAALVVGVGITAAWDPFESERPVAADRAAPGSWEEIAAAPLSRRQGEVAVWTGEEMVVLGGDDGKPCPPNAGCVGTEPTEWFTDGAAYDPATDSWRAIASLPFPFSSAQASMIGDEVVVTGWSTRAKDGPSFTLAYSPGSDTWRRLADPPLSDQHQAAAGDRLVIWGEFGKARRPAGWVLDLETGWQPLPDDPWGGSSDRTIVWTGNGWLLIAASGGSGPESTYRMASLDEGAQEWQVLDPQPVRRGINTWAWFRGRLVNPVDGKYGGVWDPESDTWEELDLPEWEPEHYCLTDKTLVTDDWILSRNRLVTIDPVQQAPLPACGVFDQLHTVVWTGSAFLAWGATADGYRRNVPIGLRWTPPEP